MPRPIVTLMTDFGDADGFVGTMKGVMLRVAAEAGTDLELVDLAHHVAAGDVRHAALALAAAVEYFPRGTVHLVVVDPGVGTDRAAIAIASPTGTFVGPDNGVLTLAAPGSPGRRVHRLESARHRLEPVSHTFHGRDVFAPAAAHLACGVALDTLGPPHVPIELALPAPRISPERVAGEVVYVDRFGNLTTNIDRSLLATFCQGRVSVTIPGARIESLSQSYGAVPGGGRAERPVALINSWGRLEIAWPGGSAAELLAAGCGTGVVLEPQTVI